MPKLPKKQGTIHTINSKEYGGIPRPYLGMSGIGASCWRQLWYVFHWVNPTKHNARTERIFSVGHLFEKIAISDLKAAGCFVFMVNKDGDQVELTGEVGETQEELIGFAKHAKGHPDGRMIGIQEFPGQELLLELKTMKDSKFKAFKKTGIKESNYVYYCQSNKYMGKMGLKVCFFLAINKDTCEYWWEFLFFDKDLFKELERKEQVILISDEPPEKAYTSSHYLCGFCDQSGVCHYGDSPEENCRTCEHCDLENDGGFSCTNPVVNDVKSNGQCEDARELSVDEQRKGCSHWEKGWGL